MTVLLEYMRLTLHKLSTLTHCIKLQSHKLVEIINCTADHLATDSTQFYK